MLLKCRIILIIGKGSAKKLQCTWAHEMRAALCGGCGSVCGPEDDSSSKRRREGPGDEGEKSRLAGTAGRQFPFKEKWLVKLARSGA